MKKKDETRYFVTDVASVPVYKVASKTEMYRMATKPGWGAVEWYSAADGYKNPVNRDRSDKTQQLCCDEDTGASLYTKNGGYFGIFPYEEINTKEMPKQAEVAAIIYSDSCGYSIWAEDFNQIHIFVTYDENGLVDTYRVEYGDSTIYDGEVEISFEDLYQQPEGDWKETYRAELPGTVEYKRKQEAAELAAQAAASAATVERDAAPALARMDDLGGARCGECGAELLCNETGDMPDVCPECGRRLEYDFFREPEGPDADAYRTRADNQQGTGTAAEAASEGRETALGTPEAMAGTDATEAAGGQQPPPQAGEIDLGRLYAGTRLEAMEQEEGKQPGGP